MMIPVRTISLQTCEEIFDFNKICWYLNKYIQRNKRQKSINTTTMNLNFFPKLSSFISKYVNIDI